MPNFQNTFETRERSNQSMLNGAIMIYNLQDSEKLYFLKLQYRLTSKQLDVSEKSKYGAPFTKWTSLKGNGMLEKVE